MSSVYVNNIKQLSLDNNEFRKVVHTTERSQIVLMSLTPNQEIGMEVHDGDQMLFITSGSCLLEVKENSDMVGWKAGEGDVLYIPEGTYHNVINTGRQNLKLYTVYTPPQH